MRLGRVRVEADPERLQRTQDLGVTAQQSGHEQREQADRDGEDRNERNHQRADRALPPDFHPPSSADKVHVVMGVCT